MPSPEDQQKWMAATLSKVLELLHPVIVYQVAEAMRVLVSAMDGGILSAQAAELGTNNDFIALLIEVRRQNPEWNEALVFSTAAKLWSEGEGNGSNPHVGVDGGGPDGPDTARGSGCELGDEQAGDDVHAGGDCEAVGGAPCGQRPAE